MDTINISEIPVVIYSESRGLNPTVIETDVGIIHKFSAPNFSINLSLWPELKDNYVLKVQYTNYGYKTKKLEIQKNHKCTNCKLLIGIGNPLYRLTKIEKESEYSERKFFRTWLFGNEECLRNWLNENNPEFML